VFGDLTLDKQARETSGVGLSLRGQAYARTRLSTNASLLGKAAGSADLYSAAEFNDVAASLSAGPELAFGAARVSAELGALWRWYGNAAYSRNGYLGVNFLRPIGRKSQLRA